MEEWLKDGIGKKLTEKISVSAGDFLSADVAYVEIIPIKRRTVTAGGTTISFEEEAPEITAFSGFIVQYPDTGDAEKIPLSRLRSLKLWKVEEIGPVKGLGEAAYMLGLILGGHFKAFAEYIRMPDTITAFFKISFDDGRRLKGSAKSEAYDKIALRFHESATNASPILLVESPSSLPLTKSDSLDRPTEQPDTDSLPKAEQPRATETSRDHKTRWSLFGKTEKPQCVVEKSAKMDRSVITRRS